jgi:hypothetical protein
MTKEHQDAALLERYRRLRAAAERVLEDLEPAGTPGRPLCGVEPWRIRVLRRELAGTPQPSSLMTMGS